ncbi:WG repeat-containing protein [Pseudotabrizicola alkalilacus]|uniref:WG repeat-containing protein n=1 Tax=Pseudotabrizicola alkalilacus TaxID=2305252 RepID=A0A411Z2Q9_9RHOB|nr:WG repeat-containing protein [Pseudotabrizicola alkalilacus]RGP37349.1 WG repeat-containing protein [Pseudotabrizicola alkalilacus]
MVIAPQFDAAFGHADGIAGVRVGEARGMIDRTGALVIAPQFQDFWRHGGGVMAVRDSGGWGVIAPDASDPDVVFDLPLAQARGAVAERKAAIQIVPSTPHFYSGQDIQSRHDVVISPDGKVMLTVLASNGMQGSGEVAL